MAAVALSSRLEVQPNSIQFGKFDLPVGNVLSVRIDREKSEVLLYCERGMGHAENCAIAFKLQTDERVKQFVVGLLKETQAYLLPFLRVNAEVVGTKNVAFVRAEFVFNSAEDAQNFERYIAPVYFKDSWVSFSGRAITIRTNEGTESDVIQRTKQAFTALNIHTDNTLNNALSQLEPRSPFFSAAIPRKIPDTDLCYRPPYYEVTPDKMFKEVEHPSQGSLPSYKMELYSV